jgi:hypothetical protein
MPEPGTTSTQPLEGKTTIDDKMRFEPERLSYESANLLAVQIANTVATAVKDCTVIIAGTQLLSDFSNLRAVYLTLEILAHDYENLAGLGKGLAERRLHVDVDHPLMAAPEAMFTAAISSAIAPATALANAALGLISLFRSDVEYRGATTSVDGLAFELALGSKLIGKAQKVILPDLMVISAISKEQNSLTVRLARTEKAKAAAWAAVGPLISELVRLEGELDRAARENDQAEFDKLTVLLSDLRRDLQPISEPMARCDQRFATLQNEWLQVDETTGLSQLARLLRAEVIQEGQKTLYLHAKVVSSGGHHRISRSLLRTLFVGDGLSFAGGAIVRWGLLTESGELLQGGILSEALTRSSRRQLESADGTTLEQGKTRDSISVVQAEKG